MEEDGFDDPPMKIKKIDVSSLGTLAKMSNTWYEVEEKEENDEEEDELEILKRDSDNEMEREEDSGSNIIQKSIDTSVLGTLGSQTNTWYQNEEDDEAAELEGDEQEDDQYQELPEITALQLMNTPIEQLIDTTNNLEGLLTALSVYSQNLNRAVQQRLNLIPK
jgi:hypothetical protein